LLDIFFGRDKNKHTKRRLYGQAYPKAKRFNAKDYFDKPKELATKAIGHHAQD
jgi:hypothetical protein